MVGLLEPRAPHLAAVDLKRSEAAARIIGMSPSWLAHDRQKPRPEIPFVRIGVRAIRYRVSDLLAYAENRTVGVVDASNPHI